MLLFELAAKVNKDRLNGMHHVKAISNDDVTLFKSDVTDNFSPPGEFFTNYINRSN